MVRKSLVGLNALILAMVRLFVSETIRASQTEN